MASLETKTVRQLARLRHIPALLSPQIQELVWCQEASCLGSVNKATKGHINMLNITSSDLVVKPYPHIHKEPFIEPSLYARLKAEYPADEIFDRFKGVAGRSGRDLYRGDPDFDSFIKSSPAWRTFYEYVNSEHYLKLVLDIFGPHFAEFGCHVDPQKAHFSNYWEPRENMLPKSLLQRTIKAAEGALGSAGGDDKVNEIYCRFDIHQGGVGYGKDVHCDLPNRLVSMVIYFCDADEIKCDGGTLAIHEHTEKKPYTKYERHPKPEKAPIIKKIRPRNNMGLLFLCSNNSYHSVDGIKSQNGYRNFTYMNLSSRADKIW
jgi:hypothetical protein